MNLKIEKLTDIELIVHKIVENSRYIFRTFYL